MFKSFSSRKQTLPISAIFNKIVIVLQNTVILSSQEYMFVNRFHGLDNFKLKKTKRYGGSIVPFPILLFII